MPCPYRKSAMAVDPFAAPPALFYSRSSIFFPELLPPPLPPRHFFSQFPTTVDLMEEALGFGSSCHALLDFPPLSPLDFFDAAADLFHMEPSPPPAHSLLRRAESDARIRSLCDRVTALEAGFDLRASPTPPRAADLDRKYTWTAEFKDPMADGFDRTYKCVATANAGEERSVKWTAAIKGKARNESASRTYTFQVSKAPPGGGASKGDASKIKGGGGGGGDKKGKKAAESSKRVVEIEEPANPGTIVLKQAFAKRNAERCMRKRKELTPKDAAVAIQRAYRAHLVRRSRGLRDLRELAVAKARLREIRAAFSNFSYLHRIEIDAEECQRFSEKIIVLLLTVDAIEGLDYIIRATKRSMVAELEAILEVVDPQPPGKLGSIRRRQFDLPAGGSISREMAQGVADVVQLLDGEGN